MNSGIISVDTIRSGYGTDWTSIDLTNVKLSGADIRDVSLPDKKTYFRTYIESL